MSCLKNKKNSEQKIVTIIHFTMIYRNKTIQFNNSLNTPKKSCQAYLDQESLEDIKRLRITMQN